MDKINSKIKNPIQLNTINNNNKQIENCKTPSKATPNHLHYQVAFSSTTLSSAHSSSKKSSTQPSTENRTLSAKKKLFGTSSTKRKSLYSSSTSSRISLHDEKLIELFTRTPIDEPLALPFYDHYGNSSERSTLSFSSPSVFSSTKNMLISERPSPYQNNPNAFLNGKSQTPTLTLASSQQHVNKNNQLQYEKETAFITTKNNKTKMITKATDENINPKTPKTTTTTTTTTNFITNTLQSPKLSCINNNNTEVICSNLFNNLETNNQMIKGYNNINTNNNNNNNNGNEKTTNATMTTTTAIATKTPTKTPSKTSQSHYKNLLTNINNNNNNNNHNNNVETQDLINKNLLKDRLYRLNKDLNSPSASVKARAIQAMKTVNGQNIYQFDVPHEEQDIITVEEREAPKVRTILDVFRNVIVYVEYRSGNDNRTDGIKSVISDIGIKVNDKLHRNTTHVIFKEGLLSTFNKAKKWNIPMVSLDWLEDCRKRFCLCDVKKYPIADIHRYENPELYKRIRRQKSMQPNISTPTNKMLVAAKSTINERDIISDSDLEENLNTGNVESDGDSTDNDVFQPTNKPTNQWNGNIKTPSQINSSIKNTQLITPSKESQTPITKDLAAIVPILKSNNKRRTTMFTPTMPGNGSARKSPQKYQTPNTAKKSLSQSRRQTTFDLTPIVTNHTESINTRSTIETTPYMTTRRRTIIFTPQKQSITKINEISPESPPESSKMNISESINVSSSSASSTSTVEFSPNPMFINATPKPILSKKFNNKTIHTPTCIDETIMPTHQTLNDIQLPLVNKTLNQIQSNTPVTEVNNNGLNTPTNVSQSTPLISDKARTNRRRTLFTPNQFMEYSRNEQLKVKSQLVNINNKNDIAMTSAIIQQNIESIVTEAESVKKTPLTSSMNDDTPKNTMVDSPYPERNRQQQEPQQSTSILSFCTPPTTTTNINEKRHNTILDEYQNSLTFSSTNIPKSDRRKTMYDISMDIINQRLHNINKIVRKKSLILNRSASESDINNTDDMTMDITLTDQQYQMQSKSLLNCSTTIATPIITNEQNVTKRIAEQITDVQKPTIKKRKLFTQSTLDMDENGGTLCEPILKNTPKKTIKTAVKKTAAPSGTSVKKQRIKIILDDTIKEQRRRSTLDFQDKKYIPSVSSFTSSASSSSSSASASSSKPTFASTSTNSKLKLLNSRKRQTIVCTSMHQNELNICNETIKKLGDFDMENIVNDRTTHVIALDSRRTINLLRGIMRGLWILDYSWIVQSSKAKKWLYEEPFELQNFSNAISMCRAERQAFGSNYKLEIFRVIEGAMYVSKTCKCPNLKELIVLGRGQVTQHKDNAKYIIMDSIKIDKMLPSTAETKNDNNNNKIQIYVKSNWILDSITNGHLEHIHKYILNINNR